MTMQPSVQIAYGWKLIQSFNKGSAMAFDNIKLKITKLIEEKQKAVQYLEDHYRALTEKQNDLNQRKVELVNTIQELQALLAGDISDLPGIKRDEEALAPRMRSLPIRDRPCGGSDI